MGYDILFAVLEQTIGWDSGDWQVPDFGQWRMFEAYGEVLEYWGFNR